MGKEKNRHKDIPHFFQEDILQTLTLNSEDSAHAIRVLRMREGDVLRITDGMGHLYEGSIAGGSKEVILSNIHEVEVESSPIPPLHIAIAPTKNMDRIEWMAEKLCEVGLSRLSLVVTDHTIRRKVNLTRVEKVIISAMKQSRKVVKTTVQMYESMDDFLASDIAEHRFIGYCGDEYEKQELVKIVPKGQPCTYLVGPEGDFSPEEVQKAIANGFIPAMFGRERLRAETAGIYAGILHHVLNT